VANEGCFAQRAGGDEPFAHIRSGQQLPQVNVVVLLVILVTLLPVSLAQRLTRDTGVLRPARRRR